MVNAITSSNGRLEVGITRESLQQRIAAQGMSESDRAAKKLMKAFEMADGLGDEGVKDGVISEKEIEAYDKEMRKKGWKIGLSIAGGVLLTVATVYLATKGIKAIKAVKLEEDMTLKRLYSPPNMSAFKLKESTALVKGNCVPASVDHVEIPKISACKLKNGKTTNELLIDKEKRVLKKLGLI